MRKAQLSFVFGITCVVSSSALSSTIVYTSEASFLSAVANASPMTNTFTGPAGGSFLPSYSYNQSGYTYTISATDGLGVDGNVIGPYLPTERLLVSFSSGNIYSVGGDFFERVGSGVFISGGSVTVSLSDGTSTTYAPTSIATSYRGFASTTPIAFLTMAISGPSSFNTMDNLTVAGSAAVPAVPEPDSTYLYMSGLAALALFRYLTSRLLKLTQLSVSE